MMSFLADAQRLCAQARECVRQLTEQAESHRVSPAQVRSLFQIVHTLKGTAAMVEGASAICEALHELEAKLTCRSLVDSARQSSTWLPLAQSSITRAHEALQQIYRRERNPVPAPAPLVRGLLFKTTLQREPMLLWFPLSCVIQVFHSSEVPDAVSFCVNGAWVPVLGKVETAKRPLSIAIAVKSNSGQAVLRAEEVEGICAWSKAAAEGAVPGLELFTPNARRAHGS